MNKTACKNYSVLLLYPDYLTDQYGEETFYSHCVSESGVAGAIDEAQLEAAIANDIPIDDAGDFAVLLVTEGHHADIRGEGEAP